MFESNAPGCNNPQKATPHENPMKSTTMILYFFFTFSPYLRCIRHTAKKLCICTHLGEVCVLLDYLPSAESYFKTPDSEYLIMNSMSIGGRNVAEERRADKGLCVWENSLHYVTRLNIIYKIVLLFIVYATDRSSDCHVGSFCVVSNTVNEYQVIRKAIGIVQYLIFSFKNVPFLRSSNALFNSSLVFITIGPPHATGSCNGIELTNSI